MLTISQQVLHNACGAVQAVPARWVQVENGLVIHVLGGHNRFDDMLHQVLVNLVV